MPGHKQKKLKGQKGAKGKAKQPPGLDSLNKEYKRRVDAYTQALVKDGDFVKLDKSFWHEEPRVDVLVDCNTSGLTGRKAAVSLSSSYCVYGPTSKYQRYACVELKQKCTSEVDQPASLPKVVQAEPPVFVTLSSRGVSSLRNSIQPGVSMAIRAGGSRTS